MSWKGQLMKAGLSSDGNDLTAIRGNVYAQNIYAPYGRIWYVDTNVPSSGHGRNWTNAFKTMAEAFAALDCGDQIFFVGNVTEQISTPALVFDVSIIGAGNRPRHCDSSPVGSNKAGATWRPAVGATATPCCTVQQQGWRFANFLAMGPDAKEFFQLYRTVESANERDASHAEFLGIRFASGYDAINDVGGCYGVKVEGCRFLAQTNFAILGVGNIGVGQSAWEIYNNSFDGNINHVKIAAFASKIKGNFFDDGGTPNTTVVLNTNNGGGANNMVVDNYFQTATANFNTPDVVGCATDIWNNISIDGTAAMIGREVGQPA